MLHIIVSDPKATKLKKKNQDMKNFRKIKIQQLLDS